MTLAWYDPTNKHVSTDKHDPLFTPLGQLWPLEVRREWVSVTKEEFKQVCWESGIDGLTGDREVALRAMEALLKEKNNA